jgi:hypothetical protein
MCGLGSGSGGPDGADPPGCSVGIVTVVEDPDPGAGVVAVGAVVEVDFATVEVVEVAVVVVLDDDVVVSSARAAAIDVSWATTSTSANTAVNRPRRRRRSMVSFIGREGREVECRRIGAPEPPARIFLPNRR